MLQISYSSYLQPLPWQSLCTAMCLFLASNFTNLMGTNTSHGNLYQQSAFTKQ